MTFVMEVTQSGTVKDAKLCVLMTYGKLLKKRICFRCLPNNHQGKDCRRAKECGVNGCKKTQDRLLHQSEESQNRGDPRGVAVVEESLNSHPREDPSTPSARAYD